ANSSNVNALDNDNDSNSNSDSDNGNGNGNDSENNVAVKEEAPRNAFGSDSNWSSASNMFVAKGAPTILSAVTAAASWSTHDKPESTLALPTLTPAHSGTLCRAVPAGDGWGGNFEPPTKRVCARHITSPNHTPVLAHSEFPATEHKTPKLAVPAGIACESGRETRDMGAVASYRRRSKEARLLRAGAAEEESVSSEGESDEIKGVIEGMLASAIHGQGSDAQMGVLWDVYEHNRKLHRKYTRLAERAADEMHHAAKAMFQLFGARLDVDRSETQQRSLQSPARSDYHYNRHGGTGSRSISPSDAVAAGPAQKMPPHRIVTYEPQAGANRYFGDDNDDEDDDDEDDIVEEVVQHDKVVPHLARRAHTAALGAHSPLNACADRPRRRSDAPEADANAGSLRRLRSRDTCITGEDAVSGIMSRESAVRPYQFATTLHPAFKLKPREAFPCSFEGLSQQMVVAYGMDRSVMFWNPQTRMLEKKLGEDQLEMDFVEHMAQLSPSLLALVSGMRKPAITDFPAGKISLLALARQPHQGSLNIRPVQRWCDDSPHDSPVSVVQGLPGADTGHHSRAFMLSGGSNDKSVFLRSLEVTDGHAARTLGSLRMKSNLKSRVSALCYESTRAYVISGSETGRICINDASSGSLVYEHETRLNSSVGCISICPTNRNLMMVSCGTSGEQIQVLDVRQCLAKMPPVLVLGKSDAGTYSRYTRPAWHPDGGLVFCPFRRSQLEDSGGDIVAIWDTRYVRCSQEAGQIYRPHKSAVSSVAFVKPQGNGAPIMVTTCVDHAIGFTDFKV
ncbi:hypothetical protein LPJ66_004074, partial [Kickxella alabastrina]